MRNQAINALLKAHMSGIFVFGKGNEMRLFFHELIDRKFAKNIEETAKTKRDVHKSLIILIYLIISDDKK